MVTLLPDWKKIVKPFERLGELTIPEDHKNLIISWWKENSEVYSEIEELKSVSTSGSLPKNEAKAVQDIYAQAEQLFTNANSSLLMFIQSTRLERSGNWFRHVILNYLNVYGLSQIPKQAEVATGEIEKYRKNQKAFRLVISITHAIIETRGANQSDPIYSQKIAQLAMNLIFEKMIVKRAANDEEAEYDSTPVINSLIEDMVNLKQVFLHEGWTAEEKTNALRNYNKLKRVLEKQQQGTTEKIGLDKLWAWASGKIPTDLNVFKILRYSNELNTNITNGVADAWQKEDYRANDGTEIE